MVLYPTALTIILLQYIQSLNHGTQHGILQA